MATINGSNNNDTLKGTANDDIIDGLLGKDTMTGLGGNDIYYVDNIGDKVVEAAGGGDDLIVSTVTYSIAGLANVEKLFLGGTDDINGTGNAGTNWLFGNNSNNILSGGASNDLMDGAGGNDILNGGTGGDDMTGGAGNDTFYVDHVGDQVHEAAGEGTDTVISTLALTKAIANVENYTFNTTGSVHFTGDAENNVIKGGSGADVLDGDAGQDTLYGNAGADILVGDVGEDILDGGTGGDDMTGGPGGDSYYVDNVGDMVHEGNTTGTDAVTASISIDQLAGGVELLFLAGTAALHATGNALDNFIVGNNGANLIDGGIGADTLHGGKGSDTYIVDNKSDIVVEADPGKAGGIDLVKSAVSFTLGDNVENLTLTGGAVSGNGNALNNVIIGNDANNDLNGGTGNDQMIGGKGDDLYFVDSLGDKVVETLNQAAGGGLHDAVFSTISFNLAGTPNVENLFLQGFDAVNATGNATANILVGNNSDNIINGGAGADHMDGKNGDDTYYVDSLLDVVNEGAGVGTGNDTIISTVDFTTIVSSVENYTFNTAAVVHFIADAEDNVIKGGSNADIIHGGGGHDSLYGNAGNDALTGGSLHDLLDGGKGTDTMTGGDGDDFYAVDNVGDKVVEQSVAMSAMSGTDTVFATASVDLLWDNVEILQLQGTGALHATGNALDNIIAGNDGANVINGAGGDDVLNGHKGNDTLTGGAGSDTFYFNPSALGNEGHDTITDFVKAEDVLSFSVGDFNKDGNVTLQDLIDGTTVVDHGAGKAVDVHFADGGEITFAGAGTGAVTHIDQLVGDAATQIHVN